MSVPWDKGALRPVTWDPATPEQIGCQTNLSIVDHLRSVVGHARVGAGDLGILCAKDRQSGYNDSKDHPERTHVGLPDVGLEWWIPDNGGPRNPVPLHGRRGWYTCGETYRYGAQRVASHI